MKKLLSGLLLLALSFALTMKTSQAAVNRLKKTEQLSLTAYKDSRDAAGKQLYSIGYGHQIRPYELSLITTKITASKAEQLFRADIAPLELQISAAFPKGITQNQFDAGISFGYNCGSGALSKALTKWKSSGNPKSFTDYIADYVHTKDNATGKKIVSPELERRRKAEIATFNNPIQPVVVPLVAVAAVAAAYLFFS